MKLIDLNRDGGIGANSLFVQLGELRILVDCGLNPKKVGRAASHTAIWTILEACRWRCVNIRIRQ
jgi:predicted metal-dependent RNase